MDYKYLPAAHPARARARALRSVTEGMSRWKKFNFRNGSPRIDKTWQSY